MSLKNKAIGGVFWTFAQQFSVQLINFAVQIVLARLLLPEVFGLIAMIQIFISVGQALMDGGMTSSLIRTKNPDQNDYSTVFIINVLSSIFIYFCFYFLAPIISEFFKQPLLTSVIRVYTISFIIQALCGVQTTRLTKLMNFKLQMYMQIPATICGGVLGLTLAYNGFGVWSIVWMNLLTTFIFMSLHWFTTGWRPTWVVNKQKLRYHFKFGYKLTLSSLLTSIYLNSYALVIGKMFSASQLGYYNQANTLRMFPVNNITTALKKVTYPLFSSLQDDDKKLKSVFKRINALVFFIICPIMFSLIIVAEPLFRLVLTEKWLPAVPYFQILSVSAIVYPLSMYNLNIILAKGRSDLHFKLEILKKGSSAFFLLLIIPFGVMGAVYAAGISMFIHAFVNSLYSGRLIEYPVSSQLKDILPTLLIGCLAMLVVYLAQLGVSDFLKMSDSLNIICSLVIYFTFYLLTSYVLKISSIFEIKLILQQGAMKLSKNN